MGGGGVGRGGGEGVVVTEFRAAGDCSSLPAEEGMGGHHADVLWWPRRRRGNGGPGRCSGWVATAMAFCSTELPCAAIWRWPRRVGLERAPSCATRGGGATVCGGTARLHGGACAYN